MSGKFVCFVEGNSDKDMLHVIIHRLTRLGEDEIDIKTLGGKSQFWDSLPRKLIEHKGHNDVFLVMCDKDKGDCKMLKEELLLMMGNKIERTKIRIACRELESFYLGDLWAVGKTLRLPNLYEKQDELCYGMPDNCKEKPSELLKELTEHRYRKTTSSEGIAKELDLDGNNKSESFNMLISAIKELHQTLQQNANS